VNIWLVRWQRSRKPLLILLGLLLLVGLGIGLSRLMDAPEPKKKKVMQEISLVKPPPPPPPPKTPPPPKEEIRERIDVPKPQEQPTQPTEAPPPGPDLAVDAAGSGSGDSFGLLGKKGGVDLVGSGIGGSRFAWYGALVKDRIQDAISRNKKLRESDYRIVVNVWLSPAGAITRVDLLNSTGSPDLDRELKLALSSIAPMREGVPRDMPQPIRLRVTAR
jgi:protein TonB